MRSILLLILSIFFLPLHAQTKAERKKKQKVLDTSSVAPLISGKHYQNDLRIDTIDFKGKITVLDFWYTSCAPCLKAIPQVEKLKEKYGDRIVVYGINTTDNNEKGIKDLPVFLQKHPISYPIILTGRSIPDSYLVEVWPTFYVIDQNGKIYYGTYGLSDNLFERLSRSIEELL
jgi:thiol-disulfide isomerase/thioredoxin